ncbi:MAG TPA: 2-oxo-4-hydroxy-4-carboxy-5-ureidoimidazoline decarboxylase [Burkholderiaceae bacterium]|nr:2-oxo-4-hydroxy-4-carboxy-5-ureidoimidazoline decarboxylase [Burkholderiaceae bacterium]
MLDLATINAMDTAAFCRAFGPVFERSPWLAERAFARRPFASRLDLQLALYGALQSATGDEKLALLNAHPELAGREAAAGAMTAESVAEQSSAGLNALARDELERLRELNRAYRERFGFPAIIAVRLNRKPAIFGTLEARLRNTREQELQNAIAQVAEISRLRLTELLGSDPAAPAPGAAALDHGRPRGRSA